jgi:hypothetical protein
VVGILVAMTMASVDAGADDQTNLAKKTQNPVADLISVPIQNNMSFGYPNSSQVQNVTNIQPVIPFGLGPVNIINRLIVPLVHQPNLTSGGGTFGLGDINLAVFVAPSKPSKFVWGAGPQFVFPSATDEALGIREFGIGPSAVALIMEGPVVAGALVNNVWTVGDASVSSFLLQYFLNFNLPRGWYLTTSPILTANWDAPAGVEPWTVPFGAGFGKILKIANLPLNVNTQGFYNAVTPGPEWTWRFQVAMLFPN